MEQSGGTKEKIDEFIDKFASLVTLTMLVFLRRRFGLRFFSIGTLVSSFLLSLIVYLASEAASIFDSGSKFPWIFVFASAFMVAGLFHFVAIQKRWRADIRVHSYSSGDSILEKFVSNPWNAKLWLEPPLIIIVGVVILFVEPFLGTYFIFAALVVFGMTAREYTREKHAYLDLCDAEIEAEVMSQMGQSRADNASGVVSHAGYSIATPPALPATRTMAVADALTRLNPGLQALMSSTEADSEGNAA